MNEGKACFCIQNEAIMTITKTLYIIQLPGEALPDFQLFREQLL